jgi:hypothetical protein
VVTSGGASRGGRNILFITTDQQRYDSLGLDVQATGSGPGGVAIATGELYDVRGDPHQWDNKWDDAASRSTRDDLVADLYDSLPTEVRTLKVVAPA